MMDERQYYDDFLEKALIYLTSVAYLLSVLFLFRDTGIEVYETQLVDRFTVIAVALSALAFQFLFRLFVTEKSRLGVHVRIVVFYLAALLLACYLFGKYNHPYLLIPALIVQYVLCAQLNDVLVFHDRFLYDCDQPSRGQLIKTLHDNSDSAAKLNKAIESAQSLLIGSAAVLLLAVAVLGAAGITLSRVTCVLIAAHMLLLVFDFLLLGLHRRQVFYAFLGFDTVLSRRNSLLRKCALLVLVCAAFSFFLSSSQKHVDLSSLVNREKTFDDDVREVNDPQPDMGFLEMREPDLAQLQKQAGRPLVDPALVQKILRLVLVVAGLALVLVFLFRPLFSRDFRDFWSNGILPKFFMAIFRRIGALFAALFSLRPNEKADYATVSAKSFRQQLEEFLKKSGKPRKKKEELDRLTRQFMTVIEWGARNNVEYTRNLAPAEYTARLGSLFAEGRASAVISCEAAGSLFEKALYSDEFLTAAEESAFSAAVRSITG